VRVHSLTLSYREHAVWFLNFLLARNLAIPFALVTSSKLRLRQQSLLTTQCIHQPSKHFFFFQMMVCNLSLTFQVWTKLRIQQLKIKPCSNSIYI
jgi:hypothetical protein